MDNGVHGQKAAHGLYGCTRMARIVTDGTDKRDTRVHAEGRTQIALDSVFFRVAL